MANSPITQATEHPASSVAPSSSSESPITQVSQYPSNRHHTHRHGQHGYGGFPSTLYLDLRGTRFEIERDVLVSLPESILIVMFPNGLILGQPARTRPHPSPSQQPPQTQQQVQPQQQGQPQHRAQQQELTQQQVLPRSQQPTDHQQPSPLPSSLPSQQTPNQQQQQQLQNPTASNQGQATSPSQHHRRQSSSDSSYYDDEDYDDDYDDDYYDDEDEEAEDEDYDSEDEEEYMSMEDQVIHVDFDPSCMAFLLNVYRQAQQAGEAHRQQQIQLMLQKQRLAQAQAQQPQHPQQKQQLSLQDLARAQALSQSQAQTQAHAQNYNHEDKKNNNINTIDSNNTLAVDQQALDPITVSDSTVSPVSNDATNNTKATVVSRTETGSGTTDTAIHNPSGPPTLSVANHPPASSSTSSPMTSSTSTLTSASMSHTTPTSQPRSSTAAQQQQNELHRLQQQQIYQNSSSSPSSSSTSSSAASSRSNLANLATQPASNPLLNKQAIIVLREELDYFAITPPKTGFPAKDDLLATGPVLTDLTGLKVKTACGQYLLEQSKIFTALQRNISKENNVAEQHLIDMLCVSGFSKDDKWGYRRMETGRTSIVSLSLVMLKTAGDGNQMATAQKLLLFWRKPARKCWWDGVQIELDHNGVKVPIRLWARRTWTLELVLV
ncbi:hypothetical protein BG003_005570 [Podila horticola]|nr:hypothetical protein BG003_005570 [Podila horticola]